MTTELTPIEEIPGYTDFLGEVEKRVFGDIGNWEQFEIKFLRGKGLAASTYDNWKTGVRQFFEESLKMRISPFRITINHIEAFFDYIYETRSPQTATVRVSQLRRFYKSFCEMYPICPDPFRDLSEALARKFRAKVQKKKIRYLTEDDLKKLWEFLLAPQEYRTVENWYQYMHALTKFLVNTGLRAFECTQIKWQDLERRHERDGKSRWFCHFIEKGGRTAEQFVPEEIIEMIKDLWRKQKGRDPEPEDHLWFHPEPMIYKPTNRTPAWLNPDVMLHFFGVLSKSVNQAKLYPFEVKFHPHYWRHLV